MSRAIVLQFTDNHFGKECPGFGLDVARDRVEAFPEIINDRHRLKSFDEVGLVFNGDNVEGSGTFPSQLALLRESMPRQLAAACEAHSQAIFAVRKMTKARIRIRLVPGNHGTTTRFDHPETNWDNVLSMLIQLRVDGAKLNGIDFPPNQYKPFNMLEIGGTRGLITHEAIPHLGTPARVVKFLSWLLWFKCDWLASGHHHRASHQMAQGWSMFKGGSLSGVDDYGESKALFDPPSQCAWILEGGAPVDHAVVRW